MTPEQSIKEFSRFLAQQVINNSPITKENQSPGIVAASIAGAALASIVALIWYACKTIRQNNVYSINSAQDGNRENINRNPFSEVVVIADLPASGEVATEGELDNESLATERSVSSGALGADSCVVDVGEGSCLERSQNNDSITLSR